MAFVENCPFRISKERSRCARRSISFVPESKLFYSEYGSSTDFATLPLSALPIGVRSICQGTNQLGTVRELSRLCGFELPSPLEPTSKFRTIHRPPAGRDQQVILFVGGAPSSSPSMTPFFISDQAPVCLVGLPCFSFHFFIIKYFRTEPRNSASQSANSRPLFSRF